METIDYVGPILIFLAVIIVCVRSFTGNLSKDNAKEIMNKIKKSESEDN